jgi:uncharacterized membrane protein
MAQTDSPATVRRWQLLRPHALRPAQFLAALGMLAAWLVLLAGAALLLDYWPIALFCALALAGMVAGFWHAARHALDGETVALHADGTVEVRVALGQSESCHRFTAAWLHVEHGPAGVRLCSSGARLLVGTQVGAAARQALAAELRAALRAADARRGPDGVVQPRQPSAPAPWPTSRAPLP